MRRSSALRFVWSRRFARLKGLRGDSGSALIEVALLTSLLGVPMLLGTAELGFVAYDSIEVSNAAHAGAMYGMQSVTFAAETSQITAVAQADAPDFGTNLTVTPTTYYACANAEGGTQYTGLTGQVLATAACIGGTNHALEFVQVNTSVAVTPPVHCPGLPTTFTLTGSSVMEVEQ